MEKLIKIQNELKCPKNQKNNFGNYMYRSSEDILEAVKPLLNKEQLLLTISDNIIQVSDRFYIKATATITTTDGTVIKEITGFAREEETKKGQDGSQITGAASSYARKYALNGMFLIDDTKDSDTTNDGREQKKPMETAYQKAKRLLKEQKGERALQTQWNTIKANKKIFDEAEWKDLEQISTERLNYFVKEGIL